MANHTCAACGASFSGRRRRFCYECLPAHADDPAEYMRRYMRLKHQVDAAESPLVWCVRCRVQYRHGGRSTDRHVNAQCERRPVPRKRVRCGECGELFTPHHGAQRLCGSECLRKRDRRKRRQQERSKAKTPLAVRPCRWCHQEFFGRSEFCNPSCRASFVTHVATHRNPNACPLPVCIDCGGVYGRSPSTVGGLRARLEWNRVKCPDCQTPTKSTSARENRRRREAAAKEGDGPTVDRLAERDGWTCHICDQLIDPTVPRTERDGATVDHLIPISKGGADTMANTALAHKWCNAKRGVAGRDVQLRLVG